MTSSITEPKLKGILYGCALGDAIGLMTEGKNKDAIQSLYKTKSDIKFPYERPINGWPICDWTDDTDQTILVFDVLAECMANNRFKNYDKRQFLDPVVRDLRLKSDNSTRLHMPANELSPEVLFAYKLKRWVLEGFPALGDEVGKGCNGTVLNIVDRWCYVKNPVGTASNIWTRRNKPALSDCIPRACLIGILNDLPLAIKLTQRICQTTHPDIRSITSCMIVTHLVYIFTHKDVPREKIEDVIMHVLNTAKVFLKNKKYITQLNKFCYSNLKDMELMKEGVSDFAFRALGCGIWALRYLCRTKKDPNECFVRVIQNIAYEGGYSCTNASVAGALMGAYLGNQGIPKEMVSELIDLGFMDEKITRFLKNDVEIDEGDVEEESDEESDEGSDEPDRYD